MSFSLSSQLGGVFQVPTVLDLWVDLPALQHISLEHANDHPWAPQSLSNLAQSKALASQAIGRSINLVGWP